MTSILMWRNFETVRRWGKENGEKRRVFVSRGGDCSLWMALKKCEGKNYENFDGFRLKIKSDIRLDQYLFT